MRVVSICPVLLALVLGCSDSEKGSPEPEKAQGSPVSEANKQNDLEEGTRKKLAPIALPGDNPSSENQVADSDSPTTVDPDEVMNGLKPLQVLLGQWRGTTNRKFEGFNSVDESDWVWDFKTDKSRPSLVWKSEKSPYFRTCRLTYSPQADTYELVLTDDKGKSRTLQGKFQEPPEDVAEGNDQPQRTYKLELTQTSPEDGEIWRIVFNQRENNRFALELSRQRGEMFSRFDTVGNQRQGTSFALNDTDYKEKTCIVSGGLGTISLSYNGKSYWVCCTGCKDAFEEEPEKWIAKQAEKK